MSQFAFTFGVSRVDPANTTSALPLLAGATSPTQLAAVLQLSFAPPPSQVKTAARDTDDANRQNASNSPCGKSLHCITHLSYRGPLPRIISLTPAFRQCTKKAGLFRRRNKISIG